MTWLTNSAMNWSELKFFRLSSSWDDIFRHMYAYKICIKDIWYNKFTSKVCCVSNLYYTAKKTLYTRTQKQDYRARTVHVLCIVEVSLLHIAFFFLAHCNLLGRKGLWQLIVCKSQHSSNMQKEELHREVSIIPNSIPDMLVLRKHNIQATMKRLELAAYSGSTLALLWANSRDLFDSSAICVWNAKRLNKISCDALSLLLNVLAWKLC